MDYDSGRTKDDIVNYMKKKSGPVAVTYATKEELEAAIDAVPVAVVGFFENTESEMYKSWYTVMAAMDDVTAIYVTDAAIMKAMNVEANTIVLYKTLTASIKFTGEMKDLKKWIILNELPLIVPFSQQYSCLLYTSPSPRDEQ